MKFSELKYTRPNLEECKMEYAKLTEAFKKAANYAEAKEIFIAKEKLDDEISTQSNISQIRGDINTEDEFYKKERDFWDGALPQIEECHIAWKEAFIEGKFAEDFKKEYGELMFINAELDKKAFSSVNIPLMEEENKLANRYENLLASAQVDFEGKKYTLSQLFPFKNHPDDNRRLAAWQQEGKWFKENQGEMDEIYDKLVKVRTQMAKNMGYENYTVMGYYNMNRNCYTREDVAAFREEVVKYIVPAAEKTYKDQAKRLGKSYPLSYADCALAFRDGNPTPVGSAEDIVANAKKFYEEFSEESGKFFNAMINEELLDLLSTKGKRGGGYCTELASFERPYIFANFNGTLGDVTVVTHEAGHAFEYWLNRKRIPGEYRWPSMEACEVHSMSMEFFAWPWEKGFFGEDTDKFYYVHLAEAIQFIPYGCLVDHFQHEVYDHPEMSPKQRHATWKRLQEMYMPWVKLDGEIPFWADGECWQQKHHIYSSPFYYIDYALAQTVSLEFWSLMQKDFAAARDCYMNYSLMGGSDTFVNMLHKAGLKSPFDKGLLKVLADEANSYLDNAAKKL